MRDGDGVHVGPQRGRRRPVVVARDLEQVGPEEALAVLDVRVSKVEVGGGGWGAVVRAGARGGRRLPRDEGGGGNIVGEKLGVDNVKDGGDQRRD